MNATAAFIALIPDLEATRMIDHAKTSVRRAVGNQRYLDDPPHLTLFLSCFDDLDTVAGMIEAIAVQLSPPIVQIKGWHVFMNDPLTGGHTPVTAITDPGIRTLQGIQERVIARLCQLRNIAASTAHFAPSWTHLSAERQASVLRWGFPFTGTDWHPHVSVASISPPNWKQAWNVLEPLAYHGPLTFDGLRLYRLIKGSPQLLCHISLRGSGA